MVTFIVSGFWHGANWTFLAWGAIHGLLYVPLIGRNADPTVQRTSSFTTVVSIATTFLVVCVAWVFFRAPRLAVATRYIKGIFTQDVISWPDHLAGVPFVVIMFVLDIINRNHVRDPFGQVPNRMLRYTAYFAMVLGVVLFSRREDVQFIYFQF